MLVANIVALFFILLGVIFTSFFLTLSSRIYKIRDKNKEDKG